MRKRRLDIYDFQASDGLNPIVMQKLNTNFWNLLEGFEDPEIVMVASIDPPTPRTDETLWYRTDTGTLYIWSETTPGNWEWVSATDVVINDEQTVELITEIASEAGDKNYHHHQEQASDTWIVQHNLNKFPTVRVEDSGGNDVIGDYGYDSTDPMNKMILHFNSVFSGDAYFN